MSIRSIPKVPVDVPAVEEEPEADAVEQRTDVVDVAEPADEAALDDDRVVPLDEDEYR